MRDGGAMPAGNSPGNGMERLVSGIGRRQLLRLGGGSLVAIGAAGALTSCAAEVFNPATAEWLAELGQSVAADVAKDGLEKGLGELWGSWTNNVTKRVSEHSKSFPGNGGDVWLHTVPPTVLVSLYTGETSDPMSDNLLACVNSGSQSIRFEPWAWQTLRMFIHELTDGKTGDDLAGFQALCLISLIPSGTPKKGQSPGGTVGWMNYQTRNGTVEIASIQETDGSYSGEITAYGIPDSNGDPTRKKYSLPTTAA